MLIEEAGYLIDDRSYERCQGKSLKEQFAIKIDSIRKSLGIDNMSDVNLLVDSLFGHEARHKQQQKEIREKEEREFQEAQAALGNAAPAQNQDDTRNRDSSSDEESERDPSELRMDPEHIVAALAYFHKTRETLAVEDGINASAKKKKSTFESEEQKREREKRQQ